MNLTTEHRVQGTVAHLLSCFLGHLACRARLLHQRLHVLSPQVDGFTTAVFVGCWPSVERLETGSLRVKDLIVFLKNPFRNSARSMLNGDVLLSGMDS